MIVVSLSCSCGCSAIFLCFAVSPGIADLASCLRRESTVQAEVVAICCVKHDVTTVGGLLKLNLSGLALVDRRISACPEVLERLVE